MKHIFLCLALKFKSLTVDTCSCFIHLQADRQTNGQIDFMQMYRSSSII